MCRLNDHHQLVFYVFVKCSKFKVGTVWGGGFSKGACHLPRSFIGKIMI